jgi:hypothetical protein
MQSLMNAGFVEDEIFCVSHCMFNAPERNT